MQVNLPTIKVLDTKPAEPVAPVERDVPVDVLKDDEWFVIQSNVELIVLTSPDGFLALNRDEGPIRLRGRFPGGTTTETREFKSRFVYSLSAVKPGNVELIIIPTTNTADEAKAIEAESIVRRSLVVSGKGPVPPPTPTPDPTPTPQPIPSSGFRVLFLYNEDITREQNVTVYSTTVRSWLKENCEKTSDGLPEFRFWDRTTVAQPNMLINESKAWQDLYLAVKDRVNGRNVVVVQSGTNVWLNDIVSLEPMLTWLKDKKAGK